MSLAAHPIESIDKIQLHNRIHFIRYSMQRARKNFQSFQLAWQRHEKNHIYIYVYLAGRRNLVAPPPVITSLRLQLFPSTHLDFGDMSQSNRTAA